MANISPDLGFDVRRVRLLAAVDELGTIAAAAAAAHLTPSAVSQQLQGLAQDVGLPLLDRRGRGVVLSPYGRALVDAFHDTQRRLRSTRDLMLAVAEGAAGTVRLAGFATSITRLLAPAVVELRRDRPGIRIELSELHPLAGLAALADGAVDLLICVDAPGAPSAADGRFRRTDLLNDVMDVALPPDHELASSTSIRLDDLKHEVWVAPPLHEPCGHILTGLCAVAGFTPDTRHHCAEWDAVGALVAVGAGIALIPRLAQPLRHPDVAVVPLAGELASRRVFLLEAAQGTSKAVAAARATILSVGTPPAVVSSLEH